MTVEHPDGEIAMGLRAVQQPEDEAAAGFICVQPTDNKAVKRFHLYMGSTRQQDDGADRRDYIA